MGRAPGLGILSPAPDPPRAVQVCGRPRHLEMGICRERGLLVGARHGAAGLLALARTGDPRARGIVPGPRARRRPGGEGGGSVGREEWGLSIARGPAMDAKYRKLAADIAEGAQPLVFNGIEGLMVNAPGMFHSLVGDMLSARCGSFALLWSADASGVKAGLRAQRHFDCIALAESMGGGGHAQACGFRMSVARLPELLTGRF